MPATAPSSTRRSARRLASRSPSGQPVGRQESGWRRPVLPPGATAGLGWGATAGRCERRPEPKLQGGSASCALQHAWPLSALVHSPPPPPRHALPPHTHANPQHRALSEAPQRAGHITGQHIAVLVGAAVPPLVVRGPILLRHAAHSHQVRPHPRAQLRGRAGEARAQGTGQLEWHVRVGSQLSPLLQSCLPLTPSLTRPRIAAILRSWVRAACVREQERQS